MATPKKQAVPKLLWNKHPDSGEYAHYKLGVIFRYKGSYSYRTDYNKMYNAISLSDAKKKIDTYTVQRIQASQGVKKIQPKKKK